MPLVVVVLLSWNRRSAVLASIERVKTQVDVDLQIVMVDNGSSDGSVASVRAAHADVIIVESPVNLGFVGGVNLGLAEAGRLNADYAWLLNDDTSLDRGTLAGLVSDAVSHPECGLFSPVIVDLGRSEHLQFGNGMIDWRRGVMVHNAPPSRVAQLEAEGATPLVPGTALLIDLRVYRTIGPFDDRLFAYWEDTDYAMRAARAGFGSRVVRDTTIEHADPGDRLRRPPYYVYYMIRNEAVFWRTQAAVRPGLGWKRRWLTASLEWVAQCRDAGQPASAAAGIDAIWDAFCHRTGPRSANAPAPPWFSATVARAPYRLAALVAGRYRNIFSIRR